MKNLLDSFKPIVKEEGIFYLNPKDQDEKRTSRVILREVKNPSEYDKMRLDNEGMISGFIAYFERTGCSYNTNAFVSKGVGNPIIHIIMDTHNNKQIDYSQDLNSAFKKAHKYLLDYILKEVLNPIGAHISLLDTTLIGKEKHISQSQPKCTLPTPEEMEAEHDRWLATPKGEYNGPLNLPR